jgi:hypothetical protein
MKKQTFLLSPLQLKKVNIAKLNLVGGTETPARQDRNHEDEETLKTLCCSQFPYCLPTLSTRPDSLPTDVGGDNVDLTLE